MISPQTVLPVGPRRQGRSSPTPGLPWPCPSLAALSCGPPVWAGAGGGHGPAAGALLLSARLSLNKQGCIATTALKEPTAPCMGERGSQETVPLGLISSEALLGTGPSQVANLSCGDTREREREMCIYNETNMLIYLEN